MERQLKQEQLYKFKTHLQYEERSLATIEKYLHDVQVFYNYVGENTFTKSEVLKYKAHLLTKYTATSANSMLAAINVFFRFCGWYDLCVKQYKIQKRYVMNFKMIGRFLAQIIAMRYGTLPITRETGGLRDTVLSYNEYTGEGNGFTFANYSASELYDCCMRAYEGYQDTKGWRVLVKRAMQSDCSWKNSAKEYIRMYEDTMKLW